MSLNYETPIIENGIITGIDNDSNKFLPGSLALWLTNDYKNKNNITKISNTNDWLLTDCENIIKTTCAARENYVDFDIDQTFTDTANMSLSYAREALELAGYTTEIFNQKINDTEISKLRIAWNNANEWEELEKDIEVMVIPCKLENGHYILQDGYHDMVIKYSITIKTSDILTIPFLVNNLKMNYNIDPYKADIILDYRVLTYSIQKLCTPLETQLNSLDIIRVPYLVTVQTTV